MIIKWINYSFSFSDDWLPLRSRSLNLLSYSFPSLNLFLSLLFLLYSFTPCQSTLAMLFPNSGPPIALRTFHPSTLDLLTSTSGPSTAFCTYHQSTFSLLAPTSGSPTSGPSTAFCTFHQSTFTLLAPTSWSTDFCTFHHSTYALLAPTSGPSTAVCTYS